MDRPFLCAVSCQWLAGTGPCRFRAFGCASVRLVEDLVPLRRSCGPPKRVYFDHSVGFLRCGPSPPLWSIFGLMKTAFLLVISNIFMTFAWYGHLKYKDRALWAAIGVSWLIAFVE